MDILFDRWPVISLKNMDYNFTALAFFRFTAL